MKQDSFDRLKPIFGVDPRSELYYEVAGFQHETRYRIYGMIADLAEGKIGWDERAYKKAGPIQRSLMQKAVFLKLARGS